jgi:hypothetical protein
MSGEVTGGEWMHVRVHAPAEVVEAVLSMLQERFGFRSIDPIDWCVLEREQDYAQVDFAPADVAVNPYTIDWRKGEDRGDIVVPVPLPEVGARATRAPKDAR